MRNKDITLPCMQRNLVISPAAASSSIEITEIDLGSALFASGFEKNPIFLKKSKKSDLFDLNRFI